MSRSCEICFKRVAGDNGVCDVCNSRPNTTAVQHAIVLPGLGTRWVEECSQRPGHYMWQGAFGLHDCTIEEDNLVKKAIL